MGLGLQFEIHHVGIHQKYLKFRHFQTSSNQLYWTNLTTNREEVAGQFLEYYKKLLKWRFTCSAIFIQISCYGFVTRSHQEVKSCFPQIQHNRIKKAGTKNLKYSSKTNKNIYLSGTDRLWRSYQDAHNAGFKFIRNHTNKQFW